MTPLVNPIPINNPTLCESVRDGKPCGGYSAYVYKTAHTTRLICDQCAKEYRAGRSVVPIIEFSLMEMIPARKVLVAGLESMRGELERTKSEVTRLGEHIDRLNGHIDRLESVWILRFLRWLGWRP
jgi:hypothetical protein